MISVARLDHRYRLLDRHASGLFEGKSSARTMLDGPLQFNVRRSIGWKVVFGWLRSIHFFQTDLTIPLESAAMFGSGNSKDKLQAKYNKLMQESYELSTVNRKKSDQKRAEAEEIGRQIDELEKQA